MDNPKLNASWSYLWVNFKRMAISKKGVGINIKILNCLQVNDLSFKQNNIHIQSFVRMWRPCKEN